MATQTGRSAKEGLGLGIVAGVIFGIMEMAAAALMGMPALMPIRMFASTALGKDAMEVTPLGTVVIVGVIAHLALSAAFGLVYGLINAGFSTETQTRPGPQAGLGILYGIGLWFVNFHIIARAFYPWFLDAPQVLQLALHAVFFGLPLGLLYAASERRVQRPAAARV